MFTTIVHEQTSVNSLYRLWAGGNSPTCFCSSGPLAAFLVEPLAPGWISIYGRMAFQARSGIVGAYPCGRPGVGWESLNIVFASST